MSSKIDEKAFEKVKYTLTGFLKKNKGPLPAKAEIVRDLDLAFARILKPLQPDGLSWIELRENNYPGVRMNAIDEFLGDESIFGDRVNNEYGDEVHVDSCIIYIYLKYFDEVKKEARFKLYENIYKTYASGAWPCGWVGKYPDGHILVYWPFKEEPTFEDAPVNPK